MREVVLYVLMWGGVGEVWGGFVLYLDFKIENLDEVKCCGKVGSGGRVGGLGFI